VPTRSRKLADGTAPANATTTVYTVPTGYVARLLEWRLEASGAGAFSVQVKSPTGANTRIALVTAAAAGDPFGALVETTLNAGDVLRVGCPAGQTAKYWMSGWVLPE